MLFKKGFGELVQDSLILLEANTSITNTSIGGITRSLIEVINKNIADYYDILDINMAMGFISTAEGYFLDLIGGMFNMPRLRASSATMSSVDTIQRFYVTSGTLHDNIPTDIIPEGTTISTSDGLISYTVSSNTPFSVSATQVYVPITAQAVGSQYNAGKNTLTIHSLGISNVYTTNDGPIVGGTDTESDVNYRYRLSNATLSAEKANEIAIRLAALSVEGVADIVIKPYSRGMGSYDIIVIPTEGIATSSLVSSVQSAIESAQALGMMGTAKAPTIVPVDIHVQLVFTIDTTEYEKDLLKSSVKSAIERYIVNIPIGDTFIINELRQQIMDVSNKIKDHEIRCYYFRNKPHFLKNVEIYWDEIFYPNPESKAAINVF